MNTTETTAETTATILPFPTPDPPVFPRPSGVCELPGCGLPGRMAIGTARGSVGFDAAGQPHALGVLHCAVHWDYRAAATAASVSVLCKAHGIERLALMAEMFVCDDDAPALDPEQGPVDPNETMRARLTGGVLDADQP